MNEKVINLAQNCAQVISDKLGQDIVALDMSAQHLLSDCFLIATANNEPQLNAIYDHLLESTAQIGEKPVRVEKSGGWILLDYVDLVIHLQLAPIRNFYALEKLWNDSPRLALNFSEAR